MALPGFTADKAVYPARTAYRGTARGSAPGHRVVPQRMPGPLGLCALECRAECMSECRGAPRSARCRACREDCLLSCPPDLRG
jgi:hypothetical protein